MTSRLKFSCELSDESCINWVLYVAIMLLCVCTYTLAQMHACLYMYMWMPGVIIFKALFLLCRCVCVHIASEVFDLELELQIVVFHLMRVLRTQLASSLEEQLVLIILKQLSTPKGWYLQFQCVCRVGR